MKEKLDLVLSMPQPSSTTAKENVMTDEFIGIVVWTKKFKLQTLVRKFHLVWWISPRYHLVEMFHVTDIGLKENTSIIYNYFSVFKVPI